jgi:hypothetical protein
MKQNRFFSIAVISIVTAITFSNCKKEGPDYGFQGSSSANRQGTAANPSKYTPNPEDRLDQILSDLSREDFSLSFEKSMPSIGITKTAYGADSYVVFADPQDLICPEPIRFRYRRIPIWKIPTYIPPTCPDMIIDWYKVKQVRELITKADPGQYGGLKEIGLSNGGAFLATEKFAGQFANLRLDKFDDLTKDLDAARFLMFNSISNGFFQRNFYGYANINDIVLKPYKINLKDLLKPTLKGCFDPLILSIIRERLQRFDPVTYKGLNVTPLEQNKGIAVLSQY